ncbi:MAG: DUF2059 domain-containing protein [Pseudoxanthomonas sp.]
MTRSALLFLLALVLLPGCMTPGIALAAEKPPTPEQIERLLQASRAESMLASTIPQMEQLQHQQFEQMTQGKNLSPEQRAEVERIQGRTTDIVRQALSWQEMKPLYVQVYSQTFSADDVKAMTKFYESDAGRHMLDKTPLLMQNLMGAIQARMIPLLQALESELKTVSTEEAMPAPPITEQQPRRKAAPAKKATTKKTPAKKTPAKKTPARKTTPQKKT